VIGTEPRDRERHDRGFLFSQLKKP
jgi:hypothetical protein